MIRPLPRRPDRAPAAAWRRLLARGHSRGGVVRWPCGRVRLGCGRLASFVVGDRHSGGLGSQGGCGEASDRGSLQPGGFHRCAVVVGRSLPVLRVASRTGQLVEPVACRLRWRRAPSAVHGPLQLRPERDGVAERAVGAPAGARRRQRGALGDRQRRARPPSAGRGDCRHRSIGERRVVPARRSAPSDRRPTRCSVPQWGSPSSSARTAAPATWCRVRPAPPPGSYGRRTSATWHTLLVRGSRLCRQRADQDGTS